MLLVPEDGKPCIRPNCPACARGDKHPNYLLAFTDKGKGRARGRAHSGEIPWFTKISIL